ncbi:hypothetical protein [Oricola cellulosilytica]|uniref:Uncharacterized protein n=1 Tax=Oricola cellulosilytica TaxID=1429082 RepID=A0A4R0PFE0_9HYPH|nr:hypothetical protein [Oricola cellulosilytica]TCD15309.1 hypothetical protein E0D97_07170 [Oricola cellulosilytica]
MAFSRHSAHFIFRSATCSAGLAAALAAFTLPATAQTPCPPPAGATVDRCLVGAWIGTNNAMTKLIEGFERMGAADLITDMTADMSHTVAVRVFDDGFFSTIPFNRNLEMQDFDDRTGDITITQFDLRVDTATGYYWTEGDRLKFCSSGGTAIFGATVSGPEGSSSMTMPVPGGGDFVPDMTYTCSGDEFSMTVALPQPIGDVDYFLQRVDPARLPEELADILRPDGG